MPSRWPCEARAEFTAELRVNDSLVSDLDCRALATVTPGFQVGHFREIEVLDLMTGEYIPAEWLAGHIRDYLSTGAADSRFISVAEGEGFGPSPDAISNLRSAS